MAHYAVLGEDGKTVINTLEYEGSSPESKWVEFSEFNPSIVRGSFYNPGVAKTWSGEQPFASWTYNNSTNEWNSPVVKPVDHESYAWDESTGAWIDMRPEVLETTSFILSDTATLGDRRISGVGSTMVYETYNGESWINAGNNWSILNV